MNFNGTNWEYIDDSSLSNKFIVTSTLAVSPADVPYIAFLEYNQGICVMKNTTGTWEFVGQDHFVNGDQLSLAFGTGGQPYLGFRDMDHNAQGSVMTYDGTDWVYVGDPGFTATNCGNVAIAMGSFGQPYLCYSMAFNEMSLSVYVFDGTSWQTLGNPYFSPPTFGVLSFGLSPTNQPYVLFDDRDKDYRATVMTFEGNNWITVGNRGLTNGQCPFASLSFLQSGIPCIAVSDCGIGCKAAIMKYENLTWQPVGPTVVSPDTARYISLSVDPDYTPYISYSDIAMLQRASVMKYDSLYTGIIDHESSSPFLLYPNPTHGEVNLIFGNSELRFLSIIDDTGQELLACSCTQGSIILDFSNYQSATYYIKIISKKNILIQKVIKY
jgi:hypothetical protein